MACDIPLLCQFFPIQACCNILVDWLDLLADLLWHLPCYVSVFICFLLLLLLILSFFHCLFSLCSFIFFSSADFFFFLSLPFVLFFFSLSLFPGLSFFLCSFSLYGHCIDHWFFKKTFLVFKWKMLQQF